MTANSLLCRNALPSLTDHVLAPAWRDPRIGIVHLGIGNFHRAHEAVYTEEAMLAAGGDWGICGVTLQGDVSKRDALMAQDGLYSVVERGPEGVRVTVIRALKEVLAMPHDRARLFELLADDNVRIVSLTVTEKGYCRDTKTGEVDLEHEGVAHDLAHPDAPTTVPGILTAALKARRNAGTPPFTVLSCDNLSHNGAALKQAVVSFARMHRPTNSPTGSKLTSRSRRRWWTASCPPPPTPIARPRSARCRQKTPCPCRASRSVNG